MIMYIRLHSTQHSVQHLYVFVGTTPLVHKMFETDIYKSHQKMLTFKKLPPFMLKFIVTSYIWANYNDQTSEVTLNCRDSKGIPPKSPKHSGLGTIRKFAKIHETHSLSHKKTHTQRPQVAARTWLEFSCPATRTERIHGSTR